MANQDAGVNLPGGFGGLTRFSEEYDSIFNLKPTHVIVFIALIVIFRIFLGVIY
ncbi:MAG: hypothetical protein QF567_01895 [Candidatus Pacearchaeota archaeon]|jgi:preprotein translocase subunit Sec61beta|nr:hypothetical protein [Candidatus Pacearchaeota archaeon]|tara:strand:- start:126 stop:287 length:162 start_codon:yes stop_codon:yes gene_type:complete